MVTQKYIYKIFYFPFIIGDQLNSQLHYSQELWGYIKNNKDIG